MTTRSRGDPIYYRGLRVDPGQLARRRGRAVPAIFFSPVKCFETQELIMIKTKKESMRAATQKKGRSNVPPDVYAPDTAPKQGKEGGQEIGNSDSRWQSGNQVGHKI